MLPAIVSGNAFLYASEYTYRRLHWPDLLQHWPVLELAAQSLELAVLLLICCSSSLPVREQLALSLPSDPQRRRKIILRTSMFSLIIVINWAILVFWIKSNLPDKLPPISFSWWMFLISAVVVAPLVEELTFRGYLMGRLARAGVDAAAIIRISTLLFALTHISWANPKTSVQSFVFAGIVGTVLGIMRSRTNSVLPCILLHIAWNGAVTFAATVIST